MDPPRPAPTEHRPQDPHRLDGRRWPVPRLAPRRERGTGASGGGAHPLHGAPPMRRPQDPHRRDGCRWLSPRLATRRERGTGASGGTAGPLHGAPTGRRPRGPHRRDGRRRDRCFPMTGVTAWADAGAAPGSRSRGTAGLHLLPALTLLAMLGPVAAGLAGTFGPAFGLTPLAGPATPGLAPFARAAGMAGTAGVGPAQCRHRTGRDGAVAGPGDDDRRLLARAPGPFARSSGCFRRCWPCRTPPPRSGSPSSSRLRAG